MPNSPADDVRYQPPKQYLCSSCAAPLPYFEQDLLQLGRHLEVVSARFLRDERDYPYLGLCDDCHPSQFGYSVERTEDGRLAPVFVERCQPDN